MSRGLNKVMIIGRLGRDPEMRYTPSGRPVTTFTVATSRTWNTSEGERRVETEWFNIVAWGNLAEICKQYLTKGQQVYILKENKPVAVPVKTGIANNSSIELVESTLKEGDEVIIEQTGGDSVKKKAGSPMGRPF